MVNIQRISAPPKQEPVLSPYDLLELTINGKLITGRPYEFSGVIADHANLRTADGQLVLPTKVASMCPDCGAGLFLEIRPAGKQLTSFTCEYCRQAPLPPPDPFRNPFETGVLDLDTVNLDLIELLNDQPQTTVASRLRLEEPEQGEP